MHLRKNLSVTAVALSFSVAIAMPQLWSSENMENAVVRLLSRPEMCSVIGRGCEEDYCLGCKTRLNATICEPINECTGCEDSCNDGDYIFCTEMVSRVDYPAGYEEGNNDVLHQTNPVCYRYSECDKPEKQPYLECSAGACVSTTSPNDSCSECSEGDYKGEEDTLPNTWCESCDSYCWGI